jgi:hypothetical protein
VQIEGRLAGFAKVSGVVKHNVLATWTCGFAVLLLLFNM